MSRSKLYENGPKIVEKKYTVSHSTPDVTPRKENKSSIRPGYYVRGLPVKLKFGKRHLVHRLLLHPYLFTLISSP